ncbi:MAG: hypothetical protein WDN31_01985 [Hyphomicrobium sp.]
MVAHAGFSGAGIPSGNGAPSVAQFSTVVAPTGGRKVKLRGGSEPLAGIGPGCEHGIVVPTAFSGSQLHGSTGVVNLTSGGNVSAMVILPGMSALEVFETVMSKPPRRLGIAGRCGGDLLDGDGT